MNGSCCVAVDGCSVAGITPKMENVYQVMPFFFSRVVKVLFIEALKMLLKTVNKMASQEAKEKRKTHNTPK